MTDPILINDRPMRLIFQSNAPWTAGGYGVTTALVAPRLRDRLGIDVAISATYGHYGGKLNWRGIDVYAPGNLPFGNDIAAANAKQHKADLLLTHQDVWTQLPDKITAGGTRWASWQPLDAEPIAPTIIERLKDHCYQPIALSHFGTRQASLAGLPMPTVIQGIDTNVFVPGDRALARLSLGWPADAFIVGMVARNSGYPSRKAYPQQIEAFAQFAKRHSDAMLYIHAAGDETADPEATPIVWQLERHGLMDRVMWGHPYALNTGYKTEDMVTRYQAMDMLLCVSMSEGFGIPLIEAQSCFPAGTLVEAADVQRGIERRYTGELVIIETESTVIEVTPEHPFWTNRGWVKAGELDCECRLLYNGRYEKRHDNLYTGRIGDIVSALSDDAAEGHSRHSRQEFVFAGMAKASPGAAQAVFTATRTQTSDEYTNRVSIPGRADRRRGNRFYPQVQQEMEAAHSDSRMFYRAHGLAIGDVYRAVDLHRASEDPRRPDASVYVPYSRDLLRSSVRSTAAIYGHQTAADGVADRVLPRSFGAEQNGSVEPPSAGNGRSHQTAQYQAIRSISRRSVTNLPVYNLTTASSTYLAGGYLVHNCGTPVLTGAWTAMQENCYAGWLVAYEDSEPWPVSPLECFWRLPHIGAIAEQLESAYNGLSVDGRRAHLADVARSMAVGNHDQDMLIDTQWRPVLEDIARRIEAEPYPWHVHRWFGYGHADASGAVIAACQALRCTAEVRLTADGEKTVYPTGAPIVIDGIELDIEDDPAGGVARSIASEITHTYRLQDLSFQPGDVVLDIGAHVGVVSCYLAKKWPHVTIYAYEPIEANYRRLERNLRVNGCTNVHICNRAITADGRELTMRGDANTNTGGYSAFSGGPEVRHVQSETLPPFVGNIALLKLDCEGAEYEILQSIEGQLSRIDTLIMEVHENAALKAQFGSGARLIADMERQIPHVRASLIAIPDTPMRDVRVTAHVQTQDIAALQPA